jgi:hypothetical protein
LSLTGATGPEFSVITSFCGVSGSNITGSFQIRSKDCIQGMCPGGPKILNVLFTVTVQDSQGNTATDTDTITFEWGSP